jgi:general L-amino acid transport system substrate-binding protein
MCTSRDVRSVRLLLFLVLCCTTSFRAEAGARLDAIRDRGYLVCGVLPNVVGFATVDDQGQYSGFEVDVCRALAAAIFGDPQRVGFKISESVGQFKADDEIDIVARRLTWTLTREAGKRLLFSPIIFYDGAGFLVRANDDIVDPEQLSGQRICVRQGSEAQQALVMYFNSSEKILTQIPFASLVEASRAFFSRRCAALAADVSLLAGERAAQGQRRDEFSILPRMVSKEPLALLMRQDDEALFLVVRWTVFALIEAEELNISSVNVHDRWRSVPANAQWLLGRQIGDTLGLQESWVLDVIGGVGNYGEIFDRHLGLKSPLRLERGLNNLWTSGGLMYAPPVR